MCALLLAHTIRQLAEYEPTPPYSVMRIVLKKSFFKRYTPVVAKELLGKYLVRRIGKKETAFIIIETEAYDGSEDKASHASRGKTMRNAPMFEDAGIFYIYLCYGTHWMLNVVTGDKGYPAAVLIRGIDGIGGPARLTKNLSIGKSFNKKLAIPKDKLWFEDRGIKIDSHQIKKLPRVGVAYAGEKWAKKPWRFIYMLNICRKHG